MKIETPTIEELISQWEKDANVDITEPGKEILRIPLLHSKYNKYLSLHNLSGKKIALEYNKIKKLKWLYYTGKMDDDELAKYGWKPFPLVLKTDITTYMDSDEDMNKYLAQKAMHDEIVDICTAILKELNSRTFQLRDFIAWERFIQGVG